MSERARPIDVHAHAIPHGLVEALSGASAEHAPRMEENERGRFLVFPSGRRSGPLPVGMFDSETRLRDMDGQRVHHQVLSAPPVHFFYNLPGDVAAEFAALGNDGIRALASDAPERLSAYVTLPLQDVAASLRELARVGDDPGVRGVAIGTAIAGRNHDEADFEDVWADLERRDLPVLVHPTDVPLDRLSRYYLRNFIGNPLDTTISIASVIFGGVLERHPGLRFLYLHGGGFAPYQLGRFDHGWRVRPEAAGAIDRSPRDYFRRLYFDCLTHDVDAGRFLVQRSGPDRVMLGSDYLFDMADADPVASIERLGLTADDERAVLEGTAQAFLRQAALTASEAAGDASA